jgi:hypothetical protein
MRHYTCQRTFGLALQSSSARSEDFQALREEGTSGPSRTQHVIYASKVRKREGCKN